MTISPGLLTILNRIIFKDEGGWVLTQASVADPSGGWTYGGITSNTWDSLGNQHYTYDEMKENLTSPEHTASILQECLYIYNWKYITKYHVEEIPTYLQELFLSAVINSPVIAVKSLQQTINDWTNYGTGKEQVHLTVDGQFGPQTIAAIRELPPDTSIFSIRIGTRDDFAQYWRLEYASLVMNSPQFLPDLAGWLRRVERARLGN